MDIKEIETCDESKFILLLLLLFMKKWLASINNSVIISIAVVVTATSLPQSITEIIFRYHIYNKDLINLFTILSSHLRSTYQINFSPVMRVWGSIQISTTGL